MSVGAATSTRMPFTVGSTTASIRVVPHNYSSFGRVKDGCRVGFEEAAKVSRRGSGNGGLHFTSISPSCKIRSRNSSVRSSANQKRAQARRVRDRPSPEVNNLLGEDGREVPSTVNDSQALSTAEEESLPSEEGGGPLTQGSGSSVDALNAQDEEIAGNGTFTEISTERKSAPIVAKDSPGVNVNDLMLMVKEAETNIMTLNQLRERAVEELQSARKDRDELQSQVQILKARLSESEAKIRATVQAKEKAYLLEEEVGTLKAKLAQKDTESQVLAKLKEENKALQAHAQNLTSLSAAKGLETKRLQAQYQSSQDEINALRVQLADARADIAKFSRGTERERVGLQEYVIGLESKIADMETQLAEAEAKSAEFFLVKNEGLALQEEVAALRVQLAGASGGFSVSSLGVVAENQDLQRQINELQAKLNAESGTSTTTPEREAEIQILQEQVDSLKTALAQVEAENRSLTKVRSENLQLREQVQLLEQRLVESDAEIRSQLQVYLAEVEAFQTTLEGLKAENESGIVQVPVGEMPWDFWSGLLLRIDALMLGDFLTQEDAKELQLMAWRREKRLRDIYVAYEDEPDEDLVGGLLDLIQPHKRPGIYVVHIAAEMAPVAKVGGLGDVLTGLSRSLQKKGHLVEAILPKYDCMDYSRINSLKELDLELHSFFDGQIHKNKVWSGIVEGLPVYFIEPLHPAKFFWRGQFYSEPDDFKRFTYFCRAALEFLLQSGKRPDIIHSHDWQTAVVPPLYWSIYVPLGLDSARLAFTCHNFEYQGAENAGAIASCGLSVRDLMRPDRMQDNSYPNKINLLKGGVVFSNVVTTVSPTYAQEVLQPEGGKGLHGTLGVHSAKFFGILNGIDEETWDPATDTLIDYQFSVDDVDEKSANKQKLQERLGLARQGYGERRPLVGCVTRLVPQKGVHLIRHAIYRTLEKGGQFILLGSSPVPHIQHEFEGIARQFENHPQIRLVLKYDEALSHAIYAASDIFVIPSIFEPCGLTQMIAMRYGSIPVVRRTGGLADSVFDVDDDKNPEEKKNGFVFDAIDEGGLNWALDRALDYYNQRPEWWRNLVQKAMQIDFSWDVSAEQYVDLYKKVLAKARATKV